MPSAAYPGLLMNGRVLVVDDDPAVWEVVADYLRGAGLEARHAADRLSALSLAEEWAPDLVVLDLMLPGIDGLEVCLRLRQGRDGHPLPVIMLTALGEESDRVLGLETGADDYVTKPFSARELALRVQAVLRRAGTAEAGAAAPPPPVRAGRFEVDVAARRVRRDGRELALTVREFDLLAFFILHPGRAFTRARTARTGVGLVVRRPVDHHRVRTPAPREGRGRPDVPVAAPDRLGRRVPLGGG